MKIDVKTIEHHRNGVCGVPFHVVLFDWRDDDLTRHMVGVVFPEPGTVAVLDRDLAAQGCVAFRENSWRGDHFEPALRRAIARREEEERGRPRA